MKTIVLSLCALIISNVLMAQNWSPINTEETFYYNSGGDELTGIRVDSVAVVEGDTVMYSNLFAHLHSELEVGEIECEGESVIATVEAGFLQSEVVQLEEGIYQFQNPDIFLIHVHANVGDEWVFSENTGQVAVIATLADAAEMDVLGVLDSVKTFDLSDGRELVLSKNHGWVEFESSAGELFALSGIPERQLGDYPIGRYEVFDFEVGDVFMYLTGGGYSEMMTRAVTRIEILDVSVGTDGTEVNYNHTEYRRVWEMTNVQGNFFYQEIDPVIFSADGNTLISLNDRHVSDAIPGTIFSPGTFEDSQTWMAAVVNYWPYPGNVVIEEINGRFAKVISGTTAFSEGSIFAAENIATDDMFPGTDEITHSLFYNSVWEFEDQFVLNDTTVLNTTMEYCPDNRNQLSFAEGLGYIDKMEVNDLSSSSFTMVGYRKGDEEFGYVPSSAEVLSVGIDENEVLPEVTVYPVPAGDELYLTQYDAQTFRIFDISGKPVLQGALRGATAIDVSNLAAGIYNGHLLREDQPTGQFRFVKR